MLSNKELKEKASYIRQETLKLIAMGNTGHTGGDLSQSDILTALFYNVLRHNSKNPKWAERDRFILSKGHCVEAYYVILEDFGYITKSDLATFSKFGTKLIGHPNNKVCGIETNSGALGHGLSVGAGMALGAKLDNKDYKVYVLMGDGELGEGSVYEAAMFCAHHKLNNLCAIIDRNHLQISGNTEDVMGLEPLSDKWQAFGFEVFNIDGHNFNEILNVLNAKTQKPKLIIANTIKGKGVSFMENVAKWHHGVPTQDQLKQALDELSFYGDDDGGNL